MTKTPWSSNKLALIAILGFVFFTNTAFGATLNTWVSEITATFNSSSIVIDNYTVDTESKLIAFCETYNGGTSMTASYNDVSMTEIGYVENGSRLWAFELDNPDTGTHEFKCDWTTNAPGLAFLVGLDNAGAVASYLECTHSGSGECTLSNTVASADDIVISSAVANSTSFTSTDLTWREELNAYSTVVGFLATGSCTPTDCPGSWENWSGAGAALSVVVEDATTEPTPTPTPPITYATNTPMTTDDLGLIFGVFLIGAFYFLIRSIYGTMFKLQSK